MPPRKGKGGAFGRASGDSGAPKPSGPPTTSSLEDVASLAAALPNSSIIKLPLRPSVGTRGAPIQLLANHFAFSAQPPPTLLRYQVDITPPPRASAPAAPPALPRLLCRELLSQVASQLGWGAGWAYDGQHTLYGPRPLLREPEQTFELPRPDARKPGQTETFTVTIRGLGVFELAKHFAHFAATKGAPLPWDALGALDIILRQSRQPLAGNPSSWIQVGANFLNGAVPRPLGATGLELWPGYSASMRLNASSPSLAMVIDTAAAAFVSAQSVSSYVRAASGARPNAPLTPRDIRAASKALRGLKVECRFADAKTGAQRRRAHRCKGLTLQPASAAMFDSDGSGGKESVATYFQRAYGLKLREPHLPCVDVSASKAKPCWLPMELCSVVAGQRRVLVEDAVASAAIIRETAVRPADRLRLIEAEVKDIAALPTLAAFGLKVSTQMARVAGRVLPTPTLEYAGGKTVSVEPGRGAWSALRERMPLAGVSPRAWGAIALDDRDGPQLSAFLSEFSAVMERSAGVRLPPAPAVTAAARGETLEDSLRRAIRPMAAKAGTAPILLLVVMREVSDDYNRIKVLLDQELGVISQCMLSKHLGGGDVKGGGGRGGDGGRGGGRGRGDGGVDRLYLGNLALKVNAKLGGCNVLLRPSAPGGVRIAGVSEVPTLLIGADVTHPSPGSDAASVAAVVGSVDLHGGRYEARLSVQPAKEESILDLGGMCAELLRVFNRCTGKKPERVVFFRDGVSEGQFQMVLQRELPQLRRAFASLGDGSYSPAVTVVIVQKRHHTRLFSANPKETDRSGNVPAGTTVDTGIVHPHEFSFFLCSHAGIQGTSKPSLYHVVADENGYSADGLQRLCFDLAHTCASITLRFSDSPIASDSSLFRLPMHALRLDRAARLLRAPGGVPGARAAGGGGGQRRAQRRVGRLGGAQPGSACGRGEPHVLRLEGVFKVYCTH